MSDNHLDLQQTLYEMFFSDPDVVTCLNKLSAACLHNSFTITESGNELKPRLKDVLMPFYELFVRDCIRMMYLCGFVAYYIRRVDKISMPFCPAIGTFSWDTTSVSSKKHGSNAIYKINVHAGDVQEKELRIMNFQSPIISKNMKTPMLSLLRQFVVMTEVAGGIHESSKWNREKHVVVTEKLEITDQTTSGLQLLDDTRKYTLTGEHPLKRDSVLKLKNRNGDPLSNTVEAKFAWIEEQFKGSHLNTGVRTHVLPPNMNVVEMTSITHGTEYETCVQNYKESVYTFFGIHNPNTRALATQNATEFVSMEQHMQIRDICNFLQNVIERAYSDCFGIELHLVHVEMEGMPRAAINNTDDIKKLSDAEMLGGGDKHKIRKMFDTR